MSADKILTLTFGKAPDGLASDLRNLADQVEAGQVKELVALFVDNGEINYLWGCSHFNAVAYTSMLQAQAIHRMRV